MGVTKRYELASSDLAYALLLSLFDIGDRTLKETGP